MTGEDVGHKNCKYRAALKGIDRAAYQLAYMAEYDHDEFMRLLDLYAEGKMPREKFWAECGLGANCIRSVREFCEVQGVGDMYVDVRRREHAVRAGEARVIIKQRYGVDHPLDVPGAKEKSDATKLARYGTTNVMALPEMQARHRATCMAHLGVPYPGQSKEVRERTKATNRKKYGGDSAMSSPEVQARFKATLKAHYGVEHPAQSKVVQERTKVTNRKKYGVDYVMQSKSVRAKADATSLKNHGMPLVEYLRSSEVNAKRDATCGELYGGPTPFHSSAVQERGCVTRFEKYGYRYMVESPEFIVARREKFLREYGVEFVGQIPSGRAKYERTMLRDWGVRNPSQSAEIREARSEAMFERTGYHWPMQNPAVKAKMRATKKERGSFNKSKAEDRLYERLVERFGVSDVIRQYNSDVYPHDCDFYIKSRDLYIELNGFDTHGPHWFGSWELDRPFFDFAHAHGDTVCSMHDDTWTGDDVQKREDARRGGLNYVVFWGDNGEDVDLWFSLGCPDGKDWEHEYSWLPEREMYYDGDWPEKLTSGNGVIFKAVHMANWREFYKPMLDAWQRKYDLKWGTIRARIYANRLKYLGKGPSELTNREILRGFRISGMIRGYSGYHVDGMVEVLKRYGIKSVYDPCAGWGERMLGCALSGVEYLGVDINENLFDGYCEMMDRYGLDKASFICGDSSKLDLTHARHDCVFTCPPYGSSEIYTSVGAENLDDAGFLAWWRSVVRHSIGADTRVFAYQIDRAHRDAMNQVLLDLGWRLDYQLRVREGAVDHMSRSKGSKSRKNFEEIQVFARS